MALSLLSLYSLRKTETETDRTQMGLGDERRVH
jgi:hypothetical protein